MINICNFCLKSSNACISVDKTLKESIELIFMNTEFVIADCSQICKECIQRVNSAFNFKAESISNEDFIVSFKTDIPWPEKLIDVYLEKNKLKVDFCQNELKICRFCVTMVIDNNYYLLGDREVDTNVREVITTHLPEVDFTITNKPIVCKTCLRKLQDYELFINSWLDIYNHIKNDCFNNKSDIIDLKPVRKLIFENSKEEIFTKAIQNGEERNEESRDCVVDKNPTEEEPTKTQSVSNDVQFMNDNFEIEESSLKTETLHFESKMELDNYDLKEEEISIDDESKVFEESSEINLNTQTFHNDIQGINQPIFNELSTSEHTVSLEKSRKRKLDSSFFRELLPKMKQNRPSLTKTSVGQLMVSGNSSYHQPIKINNGFKCGLCSFENKLEAQVKDHFENSHYSNEFTKQLGVELFKCVYCAYATHYKENFKNHSKIHSFKTKNNCPDGHVKKHCDKDEQFLKRQLIVHSDGRKHYKCQHCDVRTKYWSGLKRHLIVHSDVNSFYKCQHCDYKTKYKQTLKCHLMVHSDANVLYKCEHCDFKSKYKHSLKSHLMVHSDANVLYKCEHCDFKSKYKHSLKSHLMLHSDENLLYKCEHCDFKFKFKRYLKNHLMVHSGENVVYKCELCDFKTKYMRSLKRHSMVHSHENLFYKCEHCDFKSKFKSSLKSHLMVHSDENVVHKCEHCDFKTKYKNSLKTHLRVHLDEYVFHKCDHCGYKTKYKNNLKNHLMVHSNENFLYKCELCNHKTKHKHSLKRHLMVHSRENLLYKCEHCDFKSKFKRCLKSHLMVHSKENVVHKCDHCDFKTKYKHNFKSHLMVHSNENVLYKCELCNHKTKNKYSLKKHLLVHSNENVLNKCYHCDFKTKYLYNLRKHLIVHTR